MILVLRTVWGFYSASMEKSVLPSPPRTYDMYERLYRDMGYDVRVHVRVIIINYAHAHYEKRRSLLKKTSQLHKAHTYTELALT